MKNLLIAVSEETHRKFKNIQEKLSAELNSNLNQDSTFEEMIKRYHESLNG